MNKKIDYSPEEIIIAETILTARKLQDYLWDRDFEKAYYPFNIDFFDFVFSKRVQKIKEINMNNPNAKVELRKRILQQAALSVLALRVLDGEMLINMKKGDKVHYIPFEGCDETQMENGIVKRETPDKTGAFVVYNCGGDWDNYENYTAASTNFRDLKPGWVDNARNS